MVHRSRIGAPIDFQNRCTYTFHVLTKDAIDHFGSQTALAQALDIRQASVAGWGKTVPPLRQLQIQALTKGKLRADKAILPAAANG